MGINLFRYELQKRKIERKIKVILWLILSKQFQVKVFGRNFLGNGGIIGSFKVGQLQYLSLFWISRIDLVVIFKIDWRGGKRKEGGYLVVFSEIQGSGRDKGIEQKKVIIDFEQMEFEN